jgi:hypothetical protein
VIRISVSDLETWRYWKASEHSTLAELIARLTKQEPTTPQMEAGAAFAKLMEHASERSMHMEEVDGWEFFFDLDGEIALPPVRELKAEIIFETPSGPVMLVGKVDGIDGKIHDQKLTEDFDPERYLDSLQWRSYLLMFGAREFVYDVFRAKYERAKGHTDDDGVYHKGAIIGPPDGRITVLEYHPLRFYSYPNIRADVHRAVCELAEVIVTYGIPKSMAAPAAKEGASP